MLPFIKKTLNALFPPLCLSCGRVLAHNFPLFCDDCRTAILPRGEFVCSSCGKRTGNKSPLCHRGSVPTLAVFHYESGPVKRMVHALKYRGCEAAARTIAALSAPIVLTALPREPFSLRGLPLCLVPVPLHPHRLRLRGYNQSFLIAEALAATLKKEGIHTYVETSILSRIRETPSQTFCASPAARRENVKGCFVSGDVSKLRNAFVFVIDDVVTSGATIEEAVRCLKKAQVPHLAGLAIAKT